MLRSEVRFGSGEGGSKWREFLSGTTLGHCLYPNKLSATSKNLDIYSPPPCTPHQPCHSCTSRILNFSRTDFQKWVRATYPSNVLLWPRPQGESESGSCPIVEELIIRLKSMSREIIERNWQELLILFLSRRLSGSSLSQGSLKSVNPSCLSRRCPVGRFVSLKCQGR
jgi:hypothetical protein